MQEPLWDDQLKVSALMWPLMVPIPLPGSLRKLPEARVCFSHCKEGSLQSLNGLLSSLQTTKGTSLKCSFVCVKQGLSSCIHLRLCLHYTGHPPGLLAPSPALVLVMSCSHFAQRGQPCPALKKLHWNRRNIQEQETKSAY